MKINEIIGFLKEDVSSVASLLTVLTHLKKMTKEKDSQGVYDTDSVVQMVRNTGAPSFEYENLVTAYEQNPSVKELVKNLNKKKISLKLDSDIEVGGGGVEGSAETVSQMAQRAVSL
jgi:predicted transcriptional regulator YheO